MAELERCIIIERVKAGMRRARLEGRQIGRARLDVNREQIIRDRRSGMSLTQVAKKHGFSRASVCRLVKDSGTSDTRWERATASQRGGCCSMNSRNSEQVCKVFVVNCGMRRCLIDT